MAGSAWGHPGWRGPTAAMRLKILLRNVARMRTEFVTAHTACDASPSSTPHVPPRRARPATHSRRPNRSAAARSGCRAGASCCAASTPSSSAAPRRSPDPRSDPAPALRGADRCRRATSPPTAASTSTPPNGSASTITAAAVGSATESASATTPTAADVSRDQDQARQASPTSTACRCATATRAVPDRAEFLRERVPLPVDALRPVMRSTSAVSLRRPRRRTSGSRSTSASPPRGRRRALEPRRARHHRGRAAPSMPTPVMQALHASGCASSPRKYTVATALLNPSLPHNRLLPTLRRWRSRRSRSASSTSTTSSDWSWARRDLAFATPSPCGLLPDLRDRRVRLHVLRLQRDHLSLCVLLRKVPMELGFALGLFARSASCATGPRDPDARPHVSCSS